MKRSSPAPAVVALLALTLCACATDPANKPSVATPAHNLPALDTCQKALADVPLPKVTAKTDARIAFERDDAALAKARGEITTGRDCIGDVKSAYQKGQ